MAISLRPHIFTTLPPNHRNVSTLTSSLCTWQKTSLRTSDADLQLYDLRPSGPGLSASTQLSGRRGRTRATTASAATDKVNVLFVCLGNICRSPSAEAVFKDRVKYAGLEERFFIDSCGLGGGNEDWHLEGGWAYHEGDQADQRMRETALLRGLTLTSRSRPLKPKDLATFDYIIGMDFSNMALLQLAADYWADSHAIPADYRNKVKLMCTYLPEASRYKGTMEVPDPYYDDDAARKGFHHVLDLLKDACDGLLDTAVKEHQLQA